MRGWVGSPMSVGVCVAAWLMLPAGAAWGGTIKGTVRLTGGAVEQKKLPVTIDQYLCGKEKEAEEIALSAGKGIRNAVVSLETPPPGARWQAPLPTVQMDQKLCAFVPRVVVVPVGGTVEFLNGDRLLHNLHSASKQNPVFNRAQPHGRTIPIAFKKSEIIRVDCDLHSWMRGWVVVADHPFYAVTNDQGDFTLDTVPPGRYTLQVWQEALGTATVDVTVRERDVTPVTVEMTKK